MCRRNERKMTINHWGGVLHSTFSRRQNMATACPILFHLSPHPSTQTFNRTKLAELHTMLTSMIMIRRIKATDILKNLPSRIFGRTWRDYGRGGACWGS